VLVEGRAIEKTYRFATSTQPQLVWEFLTSPGRRIQWNADDLTEQSGSGRRGTGTVNHCMHGPEVILEEILDYRPIGYETLRAQLPVPGAPKITYSWVLDPLPVGGWMTSLRS